MIDANVHLRDPVPPQGAAGWADDWPDGATLTADSYCGVMDAAGVSGAVLVTGIRTDGYDNSAAVQTAARFPGRFASVGNLNIFGDSFAAALRRLAQTQSMAGVRLYGGRDEVADAWLDSDAAGNAWRVAESLGLSVSAQRTRVSTLAPLSARMREFPTVPVVIHMAAGIGPDSPDLPELLAVADCAPAHLVLSPAHLLAAQREGRDAGAFLRALVAAFTPSRLMWGSYSLFREARGGHDSPSFAHLVASFADMLLFLEPDARAEILGGTAGRLYGLDGVAGR